MRRHPGEAWLGVELKPDAPPEALLVHDIAKRLKKNVDDKLNKSRKLNSIEDLAQEIDGISHQTIRNIIQGRTWPYLSTIARLERYFNRKLWGTAHKKPRPKPDRDGASQPPNEPTPARHPPATGAGDRRILLCGHGPTPTASGDLSGRAQKGRYRI